MAENKSAIGLTWQPKLPFLTSSGTKSTGSQKSHKLTQNIVWRPEPELVDSLFVPPKDPKHLNKLTRKLKDTAGKSWFEIPAPTVTPEIKKDLQILKLRSVIDPKRHYKKGELKSKALPKYFQASRLTKKERKATLADELLCGHSFGEYRKRKVREIEQKNNFVGVAKWKIKGDRSGKRAKQRRNG